MTGSLGAEEVEALVGRAQAGDREAFGLLYQAHIGPIYRYLRLRVGDAVEAEDITAQVFLKALEALPSYRWRQVPFSAWLFRIAHNLAVDHFRRQRRRELAPLEEAMPHQAMGPAAAVEIRLTLEDLRRHLAQLTQLQQQVVVLRFGGGLSVAEVAQVMERSPGAVKALQHAALTELRRHLAL